MAYKQNPTDANKRVPNKGIMGISAHKAPKHTTKVGTTKSLADTIDRLADQKRKTSGTRKTTKT